MVFPNDDLSSSMGPDGGNQDPQAKRFHDLYRAARRQHPLPAVLRGAIFHQAERGFEAGPDGGISPEEAKFIRELWTDLVWREWVVLHADQSEIAAQFRDVYSQCPDEMLPTTATDPEFSEADDACRKLVVVTLEMVETLLRAGELPTAPNLWLPLISVCSEAYTHVWNGLAEEPQIATGTV